MGHEHNENVHVSNEREEVRVGVGTENPNFVFGVLGYILPFLFFLPLITDAKDDQFAKYHANQQLLLLFFWINGVLLSYILIAVYVGVFLMPIVVTAGLVFMVIGVLNVMGGKNRPLPIIGKYILLK
jgi:uncharacterized membrane protein